MDDVPRLSLLGLLLPSLVALLLASCNDTRNLAPATPDTPWQPVAETGTAAPSANFAAPVSTGLSPPVETAAEVDPAHAYGLAELIDIAERRDQTTRLAWEQARQAAIRVGMARAAYLPALTATALAGYEHIASPFPPDLVQQGYITANGEEFLPELAVRYLLFDFGTRASTVQGARALSFAANAQFTAAHQALIFGVARAYFTLDGANAERAAARETLASAELLQKSAEAMAAQGLGTSVDVALARRNTAQARYDLAAATAAQHDSTYALLTEMDLPPTTHLRIAGSAATIFSGASNTVDAMMRQALARRPDLLADLGRLRASEAAIAEARSEFYPKIAISANVQGNIGRISVDDAPYEDVEQPQAGIFLNFDWPLYQGGLLRNRLFLAQSQNAAAADALAQDREQALRQVALADDQVETGLSQYQAAVALQSAAETAAAAASGAYSQGVGTFTDAQNAQSALTSARSALARAHSQLLINAAALAFATGMLTSGSAFTSGSVAGGPAAAGR
ncbi:TolC family protein [Acidisoma sp.]|uniref:TolC family protein n=1 Tax=Acidisoma sp. TaxID=1872115 RepID=UPI003AFFF854